MTIEMLQPYRGKSPGDVVVDYDAGVCVELIRRGIAKAMSPGIVQTKPLRDVETKPARMVATKPLAKAKTK